MASFLDKTGLDTLWAKIKSVFQTTANLVTTWGSTPSDSKYPSEKLVKDTLDSISTDIQNVRTIPQDISKGANLFVNGNGKMLSNYNFSSCSFIPNFSYKGSAGSFGFNSIFRTNEFFSCDFNKKIVFSVDVKNLIEQPSNCIHRFTIFEYDIDKLEIEANQVMFGIGTLTELTQDLSTGDTEVHLADLSNSNWLTTSSYTRGFIFWNYANSYGYTYPAETYSRNVYPKGDSYSLWNVGDVLVSEGIIKLKSAWNGPTISAGTKVSRRNSGNTFTYISTITTNDTEWHSISGYMQGIVPQGSSTRSNKLFSQGTSFIKVGNVPSNLSNTDSETGKRAVITNLSIYEEPDITEVSGILPISKGGTGATTAIAAEYNILNQVADVDIAINDNRKIALCNLTKSATNGVFRWLKFANVWTWIKGKLTSDTGVNISGNAATASAAQSGSALETAINGKQDSLPSTTDQSGKVLTVTSSGGLAWEPTAATINEMTAQQENSIITELGDL